MSSVTRGVTSAERRITVQASVYPQLREWAERDGLTVADVANAILLQSIRPYGGAASPFTQHASLPFTAPLTAPTAATLATDPYETAALESW